MHYGAGFYINENSSRKQFMILVDPEIPKDDKTFICRLIKLDPRERPTTTELLQDKWLRDE
jgi:serine/threonine protein kinase